MAGVSPQAALLFKALQEQWGSPLNVTSAYRTPEHNAAVGGAKHSQHLSGNAYDVDVSGLGEAERQALIRKARGVGFGGIGVYDNSLHFDAGPERAWGPNYHKESLPGWALPALQAAAPVEGGEGMAGPMAMQNPAMVAAALGGPQPLRRGQPGPQMVNFTGPGQMEVAALLQQAAAADQRSPDVNNGTIPGGIASVIERISGAVNRGRAMSADEKRRQAIVEALGGAPAGQEGPPDPRLAALDPELYAERVAAYEASQAAAAKQAFTAGENEKDRAARIAAATAGKPETTIKLGAGETEYDKTVGKGYGEKFIKIQTDADNARGAIDNITNMKTAVADPNFYSGPMAETVVMPFKRAVAVLGGDPDQVVSMETFNAQSKKAVLDAIGGSLGNQISNADRSFIEQQAAGLQNTPQGNMALLSIAEKVQQRKIQIADMALQYANENQRLDAGFDRQVAEFAKANPLFPKAPAGELTGKAALEETKRQRGPMPGTVEDGFRFKGGDPRDRNNWEQVQ